MTHHIPVTRPRAGRESVPESIARQVLCWLIKGDPNGHSFPNQLAPGDTALSESGDLWIYNGLIWKLLVPSAVEPGEREVRNLSVPGTSEKLNISYEQ